MSDELTPKDEAMLARCFSRFKCRLMLFRMGVPLTSRHPVSDEEYQKAIEGKRMGSMGYSYCGPDRRRKWRYPGVPIPQRLRLKYKP
jgi:hypothetical protein